MTTRTPSEIAAKIVAVIEALTPAALPSNNVGFRENKAPNGPLDRWAVAAGGNAVVRLFEVTPGARTDWPVNNPGATFINMGFLVTLAYPTVYTLYGHDQRRDMEDVIYADAQQIRNALVRPSGLVGSGHLALLVPEVPAPDRGNAAVWFQRIPALAKFYVAQ